MDLLDLIFQTLTRIASVAGQRIEAGLRAFDVDGAASVEAGFPCELGSGSTRFGSSLDLNPAASPF